MESLDFGGVFVCLQSPPIGNLVVLLVVLCSCLGPSKSPGRVGIGLRRRGHTTPKSPCYSSRLKRAAERRFQSQRRSRRLFFAFGDRSGAGGGEEPRDRWPVYIHFSVVVSIGFLAPSAAARRRARPGGLGFRQSVLLSPVLLRRLRRRRRVVYGCACEVCSLLP